jgi:hypothetical protein
MVNRGCLQCEFFQPDAATRPVEPGVAVVGECRRHTPAPRLTYEGRHCDLDFAVWPRVWANAWCGEFQSREHAEDQAQPVTLAAKDRK